MIESFIPRFRLTPYQHQIEGIKHIVERPYSGLFDEMGAGKTKQTIDAGQVLFELDKIDRIIIIAPASVRGVWFDPELGELKKHLWNDVRSIVYEFHGKTRQWSHGPKDGKPLHWIITNYEFIRAKSRLATLLQQASIRTMLVLDESSAVKSHRAQQTKACLQLRRRCGRVLLLNGTPIANSPGDMFSQGEMMSKSVLSCASWIHYRARYAVMKKVMIRGALQDVIGGWQNLEDLQQRFAPYVIRRLKKDCLDLPEKLPPVALTVPLTPATWKLYREMKAEMVAWLNNSTVASASVAPVKTLRLAQITSGFVSGIEEVTEDFSDRPEWLPGVEPEENPLPRSAIQYVSTEKQDLVIHWIIDRLEQDENLKLLLWCRFRPELSRLLDTLRNDKRFAHFAIEGLYGGQKRDERQAALRSLDPRTCPKGPVIVAGTMGTGAKGLNLTASHTVVNMSYDFSLEKFLQSSDRVHRPGQTEPVSYFDVVATGPAGQRTIDHLILEARQGKAQIADWTTAAWVQALNRE